MQYKNTFLDDKFLFGRMEYKLYKNNVPKTTTLEDLYNMVLICILYINIRPLILTKDFHGISLLNLLKF